MDLVDTHCHIQSIGSSSGERITREMWAKAEAKDGLTGDLAVENARAAGVTRLLCVGCDYNDSKLAIKFTKNRANIWPTIGIHPHEAKDYAGNDKLKQEFAALTEESKVVAIGECGLDYYYKYSPKQDQNEVLAFQIKLAIKHNLPLVFHVRDAFGDFWPIYEQYGCPRGVLHSFTDNQTNLDKALGSGLYIGVNGIATFTKDPAQLEVYKNIPLERLLLETDAPFLTPKPYRGSINEPKRLSEVAEFLAELRGESLAELAKRTTSNALNLFGLN